MAKLTHQQQIDLVKYLRKGFSMTELKELLFVFDLDQDHFGNIGKSGLARELVQLAGRHGREQQLFEAVIEVKEDLGEEVDLTPYGYVPDDGLSASTTQTAAGAATAGADGGTASVSEFVYENFDLRIGWKRADGKYPVEVTNSPRGQMPQPEWQEFPLDDYDFTDLVAFLRDLMANGKDAVELGRTMRNLLFPGQVWNLYNASRAHTQAKGKGLRLRLRVDPPELSNLPWEYAYDDTLRFFALERQTPMVRYIAQPFAQGDVSAPSPMKVLAAIAAPSDWPELKVDVEEKRIRQVLEAAGDRVDLTVLRNATADKLHGALANQPHIFHFIGHGKWKDGRGYLILETIFGESNAIDADQLMILLKNSGVKVVVLNACETAKSDARDAMMGVAPALVQAEIPAVIAMQFEVPDKTALGFTRDLYRFLVAGYPLDRAVTEMRIGAYIGGGDKYYWGIPALFMRANDGVIWQPDPSVLQLFDQLQTMTATAAEESLADLTRKILELAETYSDKIDERDLNYVTRGLNDAIEALSQDEPKHQDVEYYLSRVVEDIQRARSEEAEKELVPKVEFVVRRSKELYG